MALPCVRQNVDFPAIDRQLFRSRSLRYPARKRQHLARSVAGLLSRETNGEAIVLWIREVIAIVLRDEADGARTRRSDWLRSLQQDCQRGPLVSLPARMPSDWTTWLLRKSNATTTPLAIWKVVYLRLGEA